MGKKSRILRENKANTLKKRTRKEDIIPDSIADLGGDDNDEEQEQKLLSLLSGDGDVESSKKKRKTTDAQIEDTAKLSLDEQKIQYAKQYLNKIKEITDEIEEADSAHKQTAKKSQYEDPVSRKLREEAEKQKRKAPPRVSDIIASKKIGEENVRFIKGHHKPVTCLSLTADDKTVYTGSKDCCVIQWDVETGKKTVWKGFRGGKEGNDGHKDEILAIAVNTEGTIVASAGKEDIIRIWDVRTGKQSGTFPNAHAKTITGLAFQKGTDQLFSSSLDRTLKVWDAKEVSYVESLYGHEGEVNAVDALFENRAISAGNDNSIRVWKIEEETQLIFKGHTYSIDCLRQLSEASFISGSQDGSLSLWGQTKKKPFAVFPNAHGGEWISSVGTLRYSMLGASGSCDGYLKLWRCSTGNKTMNLINQIPIKGFINGIEFAHNGRFVVAGVGQEHRLGRWKRIKEARNGIAIVKLLNEDEIPVLTVSQQLRQNKSNKTNGTEDHSSSSDEEDNAEDNE